MNNERIQYAVDMLFRLSTPHMDYFGLMPYFWRLMEIQEIMTQGSGAKYWLSTRLLLGLGEDEANEVTRHLREYQEYASDSRMRLDGLGLAI